MATAPPKGAAERDFTVANLSCPVEVMQFNLVYRGPLPASANKPKPKDARDIRDALHPQLEYLWQTHAALERLRSTARVPMNRDATLFGPSQAGPFDPVLDPSSPLPAGYRDLCEPQIQESINHIPLVRKSLDLNCSLDILFLRHEDPGSLVLQGGDVDGRIKTLLDALSKPKIEMQRKYRSKHTTLYTLLENDSLVSGLNVSTDRLLVPPSQGINEVHLIIKVKVWVLRLGPWNVCLMGA